MSSEAWKDTGDCSECRRRKYCKSECKRSKLRLKELLRTTEIAVIGECSDQKVEAVYEQCRKLAMHSTFSVRAVVSVLCAQSRARKLSIAIAVKDMDKRLQEATVKGL